MARTNLDLVAVDLLLAGDMRGLKRLAAKAKAALEARMECPDCGDEGPKEENGGDTVCCTVCGCHIDLESV